jgi:hypothetical protein
MDYTIGGENGTSEAFDGFLMYLIARILRIFAGVLFKTWSREVSAAKLPAPAAQKGTRQRGVFPQRPSC